MRQRHTTAYRLAEPDEFLRSLAEATAANARGDHTTRRASHLHALVKTDATDGPS